MKRSKISGYNRYTTDGVSVFRGGMKQRLFADGFHLIPDGEKVNFDVVKKEVALGKVSEKPKKAGASKPSTKGKRKSKK